MVTQVQCPRCRAEGEEITIIMDADYGVCPRCDTTWTRGKHNEMIAN